MWPRTTCPADYRFIIGFIFLISTVQDSLGQDSLGQDSPFDVIAKFCEARKGIETVRQTWRVETNVISEDGAVESSHSRRLSILFDRGKLKSTTIRETDPNRVPIVIVNEEGALLHNHDDTDGGVIGEASNGSVEMLFDPRLMGIVRALTPAFDADQLFPAEDRGDAQFIQSKPDEPVPDILLGVEYKLLNGATSKYWVSKSNPKHVLVFYDSTGKHRWISTYLSDDPIPVKSKHLVFASNDRLLRSTTYERLASEYDVQISADEFSVSGLGLKIGEPLIDARKDLILGVWDGQKIVSTPDK